MTERIIQELTKALIEEFTTDLEMIDEHDDNFQSPTFYKVQEKWEKRLTKN